nr:hypothetical protein [uncultured Dysosmobacter sp.]
MRGYKEKMAEYRLPTDRTKELRRWCLQSGAAGRPTIEAAANEACGDALARWIVRHVTTVNAGYERLKQDKIPVGVDMFRVYRARFFWLLDKKLPPTPENTPQGGATHARKPPRSVWNTPRAE